MRRISAASCGVRSPCDAGSAPGLPDGHDRGMTTMTFGPGSGHLHLLTGVEGKAARLGHDLVLDVADWSAQADLDGDVPTAVRLRAALSTLSVQSGTGGAKALSDKDRATILKNALGAMRAAQHPEVVFTSKEVTASGDGFTVNGDLSIGGQTRPTVVQVTVSGTALSVRSSVVQTAFDVEPYSAMLGALRLRDRVDVELVAAIPG